MRAAKTFLTLTAALVLTTVLGAPAFADTGHFYSATSSVTNTGALSVAFDERGLGNLDVDYLLTADATASYACINGGSNHPQAANKETVNGPVSGGGTFPVRNGQTTGSITVAPPSAGDFSCPNGQRLVLASVCYANVTLTGSAGDTAIAEPNPACRTFFNV
jgi:hypothetical protein